MLRIACQFQQGCDRREVGVVVSAATRMINTSRVDKGEVYGPTYISF